MNPVTAGKAHAKEILGALPGLSNMPAVLLPLTDAAVQAYEPCDTSTQQIPMLIQWSTAQRRKHSEINMISPL